MNGGEVQETDESWGERRRYKPLLKAVERELHGAGARPKSTPGWWSFELPTGVLLKVTGVTTRLGGWQTLWRELLRRRARRVVGALVSPPAGQNKAPVVSLPLDEFASLLGRLDSLERQRERWLDGVEEVGS